jgi:AraC family transcriptional regulator
MIKSIEVIWVRDGIHYVNLATDDINPRVLNSYLYTQGIAMPKGYHLPNRVIYDYELEFFTQSEGAMYIEDKLYPIQSGDLVFRRPGQNTQGIMPYCCYLISFDLTGATGKSSGNYHFCVETDGQFQDYYRNPVLDPIPPVFHPQFTKTYLSLFDLILKEFINPSANSSLLLKAYIIELLCNLSQDTCNPLDNQTGAQSPHGKIVKKTIEFIQINLNSPLSLKSLAKLAGFSPTYFHKIFRETTGFPLNEYVIPSNDIHKGKSSIMLRRLITMAHYTDAQRKRRLFF